MKNSLFALVLCVCVLAAGSAMPADAQDTRQLAPFQLFLPALATGFGSPTPFGVEVTRVDPARGLNNLRAIHPTWVRRNGLHWNKIEPVKNGGYRWNDAATVALESDMIQAAQNGMRMILVIHRSPSWAVSAGAGPCGPILPSEQASFARFLQAAVARYSKAPYYVRYWEIGNEPDAPVVATDTPYGCWGDVNDPYYGGRTYGEALKGAYAAIKAVDPNAVVLNGGLLLDQPYDPATNSPLAGRFFEGMLEAGAGNAFDLLSYHSYSFYDGDPDGNTGPNDWKPGYLRGLMQRYGINKPLINTESALLCAQVSSACTTAQAYAVPRLYARAMRDGLSGLIWFIFDSDGFRNTALVEPSAPSVVRPAHSAYVQARKALGTKRFVGALTNLPPGVEGFRFSEGNQTTLVIWAGAPTTVRLNVGAASGLACNEWNGAAFVCATDALGLSVQALPGARYITFRTP